MTTITSKTHYFILAFVILLAGNSGSVAQSLTLKVVDERDSAVAFAAVVVLDLDSSLLEGNYTDTAGIVTLQLPTPPQRVLITVEHLSFMGEILTWEPGMPDRIATTLRAQATFSEAVTVTAKKPVYRRAPDRLIMDVSDQMISAGEDGFSLLTYLPGVRATEFEGIRLNGRGDVLIVMDRRTLRLAQSDAIAYLRSIPAERIKQIEVMPNPPAEFDAEGIGGVIRIVTDRSSQRGWASSLNTRGVLARIPSENSFATAGGDLTLGYSDRQYSLSGRYLYGYEETGHRTTGRRLTEAGALDYRVGLFTLPEIRHQGGLEVGYFPNDFHEVALNLTVNDRRSELAFTSQNDIEGLAGQSLQRTVSDSRTGYLTYDAGLGYTYTSKDEAHELQASANWYQVDIDDAESLTNFNAAGGREQRAFVRNVGKQLISIQSAQLDYEWQFSEAAQFKSGLKASEVGTDNGIALSRSLDGRNFVPDPSLTSDFTYDERVLAAYTTLNFAVSDKLNFQGGLRLERTLIESETNREEIRRQDYLNLFPTLYAEYLPAENHELGLTYNYRLQRPDYEDLNPYLIYVDPFLLIRGNPLLTPSYSHTAEASYTFAGQLTGSLRYVNTTDYLSDVWVPSDEVDNRIIEQTANVGTLSEWSLGLNAYLFLKEWWQSVNTVRGYSSRYVIADEGPVRTDPLEALSVTVQSQNSFELPSEMRLTVTTVYVSPSVEGAFTTRSLFYCGLAIAKKFAQDQGRITLKANDIFGTYRPAGGTSIEGLKSTYAIISTIQSLRLSVNYRIAEGKKLRKPGKERSNKSELDRLE